MKKILKGMCCIVLSLSILIGSLVASGGSVQAASSTVRNNPFYYRYEETPLVFKGRNYISKKDAATQESLSTLLSMILSKVPKYGDLFSKGYDLMIILYYPILGKSGYLEIYTGEKRQIATSTITGKSHISARWAKYRFVFIAENGMILMDRKGELLIH